MTLVSIFAAAEVAALSAGSQYVEKYGDHSTCGAAVVAIPGKYRKLIAALEEAGYRTQRVQRGYWVTFASELRRYQSLSIHESAQNAAVKVFRENGFPEIHMHSWVD